MAIPCFDNKDRIILEKLFKQSPREMRREVTNFFIQEMFKYIDRGMIWRNSIMGETRGGKSEVGTTQALIYTRRFNENLKKGVYDGFDIWDFMKKRPIVFNTDFIMSSQSDYIYKVRHLAQEKKMTFGQIWQIDEQRGQIGGLGSFSEEIDLNNLNNIVAKFMQSEIWITPQKFESRNAPYGLYVYKKDIVNRVNWCLLYKITMTARYTKEYNIMGWVKVPLHDNDQLRKEYNDKKNEWITGELSGSGNKRIMERKAIAVNLSDDELFSKVGPSGKSFVLSKEQQISILEEWIVEGKSQNWNELEKLRIVMDARMLILRKKIKKDEEMVPTDKNMIPDMPVIENDK